MVQAPSARAQSACAPRQLDSPQRRHTADAASATLQGPRQIVQSPLRVYVTDSLLCLTRATMLQHVHAGVQPQLLQVGTV